MRHQPETESNATGQQLLSPISDECIQVQNACMKVYSLLFFTFTATTEGLNKVPHFHATQAAGFGSS